MFACGQNDLFVWKTYSQDACLAVRLTHDFPNMFTRKESCLEFQSDGQTAAALLTNSQQTEISLAKWFRCYLLVFPTNLHKYSTHIIIYTKKHRRFPILARSSRSYHACLRKHQFRLHSLDNYLKNETCRTPLQIPERQTL